MIYLFTALYCEAELLIKRFHLEKNLENTRFQEFYQEEADIRLTITGVGEIAAAAAVSSICTAYMPKAGDLLLNIGTCACPAGKNGVYVCNRITEQATGRTFYPDLLYRHGLPEEAVVTGILPCDQEKSERMGTQLCRQREAENDRGFLYDMEAAAIYQAGSYFFAPHQMMFVKIVSDAGMAQDVSREDVEHLMKKYQDVLCGFIEGLTTFGHENGQTEDAVQREENWAETLCSDLHCSKVMADSLRQHLHYWELAEMDYISVIQEMYRDGLLPCRDKREGKLRFEELKKRLF